MRGNQRSRRRELVLLASGPVLGAAVGALTNVLTETWNWWLFLALVVLTAGAAAGAALVPGSSALPAPSPGDARRVPRTLPPQAAVFAGRTAELAALRALLDAWDGTAAGRPLVCVITGPSGSGKTELAVRAGHMFSALYPDGQIYLACRAHAPAGGRLGTADLLSNAFTALDLPIPPTNDAQVMSARWRSVLGTGRYLLVLDDLAEPDQARALLPPSPRSLVMITARALPFGLDPDLRLDLGRLSRDEAREIVAAVMRRAARPVPEETLDLLAGAHHYPLHLRHVAERLTAASETGAPSAAPPPPGGPAHEDVMRSDPFEQSLAELSPAAALAFRRTALHPGPGLTAERLAALMDVPVARARAHLDTLTLHGLLTEGEHGRRMMHDRLGSLAAREGAAHDSEEERARAEERLFLLTAAQLAVSGAEIGAPLVLEELAGAPRSGVPEGEKAALEWLGRELGDLQAVVRLAASRSWAGTWRPACLLTYYQRVQRRLAQARELNTEGLRTAVEAGDLRGQAHSHAQLGVLGRFTGEYRLALDHLEAARDMFSTLADARGGAQVDAELAVVHQNLAHYGAARAAMERALALHERLGDERGVANALGTLGMIDRTRGDYAGARPLLEQALDHYERLGAVRNEAWIRIELGTVDRLQGAHERALRQFNVSRELFAEAADRSGVAWAARELGVTRRLLGEYPEALELLSGALHVFTELGSRRNAADARVELCTLLRLTGRLEDARRYGEEALAAYTAMGNSRGEAWTSVELSSLGLARLAVPSLPERERDELSESVAAGLSHAREIYTRIEDRSGRARVALETGRLLRLRGRYAAARDALDEARTRYGELGARHAMAEASALLATLPSA